MKILYYINHSLNILWLLLLIVIILPFFWFCMYITKGDIKYPEERAIVIKRIKKLYPISFIKEWLLGFKYIKKGKI